MNCAARYLRPCLPVFYHLFISQSIDKIRSDLERSDALRKTAAIKEKDSLERLQSQIQAEQKLKAGVFSAQLIAICKSEPAVICCSRLFSPTFRVLKSFAPGVTEYQKRLIEDKFLAEKRCIHDCSVCVESHSLSGVTLSLRKSKLPRCVCPPTQMCLICYF
jgi:hypothetical protein